MSVLILACAISRTWMGLAITPRFTWRPITRSRRGIAGCRDDDTFRRQSRGKRRKEIAAHAGAAEPPELAALPSDGLGKARWMSNPMMPMPLPLTGSSIKNGNWRGHDPDGLTLMLICEKHSRTRKAPGDYIPDNGICERLHKTMLNEIYRIAFRKQLYASIADLQADLDEWIRSYKLAGSPGPPVAIGFQTSAPPYSQGT